MCNSANCSHSKPILVDDELDDIFPPLPEGHVTPEVVEKAATFAKEQLPERFKVKCKSCGGSGRFVSYTGRVVGNCFKCKGKGHKFTKTDPAKLEAARKRREEKKAEQALEMAQKAIEWREANPEASEWMLAAAGRGFEFAQSLNEALLKYGHLTEKQMAAVNKCLAKDKARKEARAEAIANAPAVDISKVKEALELAKQNGLEWPKLRLGEFVLSRAGDTSRNAGSIYVKQGKGFDAPYMGRITDGAFIRGRECTDEQEAELLELCSKPLESAVAYGKKTGKCACCGRKLTNAESIEFGIGPICRDKFFG